MKRKLLILLLGVFIIVIIKLLFFGGKFPNAGVSGSPGDEESKLSSGDAQNEKFDGLPRKEKIHYKIPEYIIEKFQLKESDIPGMEQLFMKLKFEALNAVAQYATCEYSSNDTVGLAIGMPQDAIDSVYERTFQSIKNYIGESHCNKTMTDELETAIADELLYYARCKGTFIINIQGESINNIKTITMSRSLLRSNGRVVRDAIAFTQDAGNQFMDTFGSVANCALENWQKTKENSKGPN
ncbi:hypothetical protein [Ereboglobus luteus]|uniref:Uncharacterized protein n=1 Tax=Ereboglobus luteus TaxID=1796921 RepID=A0A2U8E1U8_9BACT|nr:hypothetical protein [Ereboglobus luteus]AWI08765.1 hypothetical protein CKA38_05405 [Ereboglobus luteus]